MSRSLIVPMNLAALCVGHPDHQLGPNEGCGFGKIAVDFQMLPSLNEAYLSKSIVPDPFEGEARPMPGIHLHWALPDALTRTEISRANGTVTRPAPNRFLVVRLHAGAASLNAWVVESDYLWRNDQKDTARRTLDPRNCLSRAVPLDPKRSNTTFAYQGRVVPAAEWNETHPNSKPENHTALGYGTEIYAAAYPNCCNVFGFFDPLVEAAPDGLAMEKQVLSYLVIGWYSQADCDPIKRQVKRMKEAVPEIAVTPTSLANELKANYQWSYSAEKGQPEQTLCVAQLISLEYDPATSYLSQTQPSTPLDIALGGSTAEALSALIANTLVTQLSNEEPGSTPIDLAALARNSETLLNDLQCDLLPELQKLGTDTVLANLHDALHRRDFAVHSAGHSGIQSESGVIWSVGLTKVEPSPKQPGPEDVAQPLPDDIGAALIALNRAQARYDEAAVAVATRRAQVFADWSQFVNLLPRENQPAGIDRSFIDAARDYITAEIAALGWSPDMKFAAGYKKSIAGSLWSDLEKKSNELNAARNALAEDLLDTRTGKYKGKYKLENAAAPRFYQPSDPVILLSGSDAKPSNRYGGDGRYDPEKAGNLICRLSGEITAVMEKPGATRVEANLLPRLNLPGLNANSLRFAGDCVALVAEAIFLDPGQARMLAGLLEQKPGNAVPDELVAAIQADQEAYRDSNVSHTTRVVAFHHRNETSAPSKVGLAKHAKPWIPLILQWEATYSPFDSGRPLQESPFQQDWILNEFELNSDQADIVYKGTPPQNPPKATYQGTVTLTHNAERNLKGYIEEYLKAFPINRLNDDPTTQKMKEMLGAVAGSSFSIMAQAMGGFHRQLLMRNQILQLPVFQPGAERTDEVFANLVKEAVGKENDAAVLAMNQFNPLRAGTLKLTRLRIVDAFGQARDVLDEYRPSNVLLSSRMKSSKSGKITEARLPLRISQPARLSFRFQSASAPDPLEMNSDPASTPIFGWVLYNRLDHTLAVYDEVGSPVGSFNVRGLAWQEAPGPHRGAANPHLRQFLKYLGASEGDSKLFLDELMQTIDNATMGIEPDAFKQDRGLAVLIGRPLALVRAELRLDLYGLPAIDQSLPAFKAAVDSFLQDGLYSEPTRRSADFARCRFPVRLGDFERANDGLVGYFIESENQADTYATFYACKYTPHQSKSIVDPRNDQRNDQPRLWLCPGDKKPRGVIMLVDPRAPVHALTGVLPIKSIDLPPVQFADAMKRISVTFLTAPVLAGAGDVALAVPTEVGHAWSWLARQVDEEHFGVRKWITQNVLDSPNASAAFSAQPLRLSEGWLHLYPAKSSSTAPDPMDILVLQDAYGVSKLSAQTARLHGIGITVAETDDGKRFIGYWNDDKESVSWKVKLTKSGEYIVALKYSTRHDASAIKIEVRNSKGDIVPQPGEQSAPYTCLGTGDWGKPGILSAKVTIGSPNDCDEYVISVRPEGQWKAINVWWVWLHQSELPIVPPARNSDVTLTAKAARLHGTTIRKTTPMSMAYGGPIEYGIPVITDWTDPREYLTWLALFNAPGLYNTTIEYSALHATRIVIEVRNSNGEIVPQNGQPSLSLTCPATGDWFSHAFLPAEIEMGPPDEYVIKVKPDDAGTWQEIRLWQISLSKVVRPSSRRPHVLLLDPGLAFLHGRNIHLAAPYVDPDSKSKRILKNWIDPSESISWRVNFTDPGQYYLTVAHSYRGYRGDEFGLRIEVRNAQEEIVWADEDALYRASDASDYARFGPHSAISPISIVTPGEYTMTVQPTQKRVPWKAIQLWWIELTRQ